MKVKASLMGKGGVEADRKKLDKAPANTLNILPPVVTRKSGNVIEVKVGNESTRH